MNKNRKIGRFDVPEYILELMAVMEESGNPIYLVGGCVRDCLMGRKPVDWDFCTPAQPTKVMQLYKERGYSVIPVNIKHGTVMVIDHAVPYEITAFRHKVPCVGDMEGTSGSHVEVCADGSLSEDLGLRDFTINSMAWNSSEGLIDLYDGQSDLQAARLRCRGNAMHRISEDPLRILRAIRFAAHLNFRIDDELKDAMFSSVSLLDNVAVERITSELYRLMQAPGKSVARVMREYVPVFCHLIPELKPMVGFDQRNPNHSYDVWEHTMKAMEACCYDDLVLKFTVLFHDMGKPHTFTLDNQGIGHFYGHCDISAGMCKKIMHRLKFDIRTAQDVAVLVEYHDARIEPNTKSVRRWLNRIGLEQFNRLILMKRCDAAGQNPAYWPAREEYISSLEQSLEKVLSGDVCYTLKDLAVKGSDLIAVGYEKGAGLGRCLKNLLDEVLDERLPNDRQVLLAKAMSWLNQDNKVKD